ncbi:MAG: hypothetical protein WBV18_05310 [Methyloceanibacter sp.]|jgi:hypothetical protein|uniref:hypothetical protein n=1 Tax=Methyloceanibacter sp. TaxID=1965321 RepID=UPI003C61EE62
MSTSFSSRMTAAKRSAEAIRSQSRQRHESFMRDQEREREATSVKTARLRELRLAKEAAEKKAAAMEPTPAKRTRTRRSKQT